MAFREECSFLLNVTSPSRVNTQAEIIGFSCKTGSTSLQATETSFQILTGIIELDETGTIAIANHFEMTKSTVYNHLQTLLENEYIVKDGDEYEAG